VSSTTKNCGSLESLICAPPFLLILHLKHSAHQIDSIYNDSRQLEWVGYHSNLDLKGGLSKAPMLWLTNEQARGQTGFTKFSYLATGLP